MARRGRDRSFECCFPPRGLATTRPRTGRAWRPPKRDRRSCRIPCRDAGRTRSGIRSSECCRRYRTRPRHHIYISASGDVRGERGVVDGNLTYEDRRVRLESVGTSDAGSTIVHSWPASEKTTLLPAGKNIGDVERTAASRARTGSRYHDLARRVRRRRGEEHRDNDHR